MSRPADRHRVVTQNGLMQQHRVYECQNRHHYQYQCRHRPQPFAMHFPKLVALLSAENINNLSHVTYESDFCHRYAGAE
ncbi:Uncharacterised protein [Vibrio cholerae]|uniref:Uncharacterized protein n=1 Tax=Vibrio cholerae TaxID=666 RepID=A0A655YRG8_VIBCL|nr:Uncharacterised protein [Vibrio cholerae]